MDSSVLNMSDVLTEWQRATTIKTVTITTTDFVQTESVTVRSQNCVVQVADKEKLQNDTIDWSKEYLLVHSKTTLAMGELIEFDGKDYKIISRGPWRGYGYIEVIAEETREPLREETECE